jgi:signal transduction histidine kinase
MRFFWTLSRAFYKPGTLWCLFGIVLFLAIGGLGLLSRHALRLSHQQSVSEQREDLQQNIRVALWRLDSRLGPFIATLHDPTEGNPFNNPQSDKFVMQRFRIHRAASKGEKGVRFAFAPAEPSDGMMVIAEDDNWQRLVSSIPVDSIVSAVDDLIPQVAGGRNQALVQGYDAQVGLPDEQRELGNRNMIVQQQVALNTSYAVVKGRGGKGAAIETEQKKDTKLMSVWIDDQLVVVRSGRTSAGDLEGVWVDWPSLRQSLADDIADLVPGATLHPVKRTNAIDPSRTLAAVPAMVVSPQREFAAFGWSPTHTALLLAWCALVASVLIAAAALNRLIALSERRASFVSAVTHELRTPLTTFRLYSDLLARNMVNDPVDRQEYLETLRREADRLTHLVDNVLRYSKLQRTSKHAALETVVLSEWIDRIAPRLTARLADVDMTLVIDQVSDGRWSTDPPAMEQVLFNLVDNAAKYARSAKDRRVHLQAEASSGSVILTISDHGPGVPESLRSTIFKPFAKSAERAAETAAGVGLGLALARQTAIALGGTLSYLQGDDGGASFRLIVPQDSQAKE